MPIYEYKCTKGHVFDVIQKMAEDPLSKCQECGAPAERVLHPVAVHFKGSGFYNTDYGKKKAPANGGSSSEGSSESKDAGSKGSESTSGSKSSDSKSSDSTSKATTSSD